MSVTSYLLYSSMMDYVCADSYPGISYWVCQMRDPRYGTIWARVETTEQLYDVVDHLIQGAGELSALNDFVIRMYDGADEVNARTLRKWADDHDIRKMSLNDRLKRDQERRKREQRN